MATSVDQRSMTDPSETRKQRPVEPADAYREALSLWLEWNRAYEELTARIFDSRTEPRSVEDLLDQVDKMRQRAIERSEALLAHEPPADG
jgi:hypothetical protein